jgi:ATP-dependent DNA helicase 2 subunit 1
MKFVKFLFAPPFWFLQREKKNLQDLEAVYVFNVEEREPLDKPTARLIKELSSIEGTNCTFFSFSFGKIRSNSLHLEEYATFF